MFAAAMLDAWPHLEAGLIEALERAGFADIVSVESVEHNDGVLAGRRFCVTPSEPEEHGHAHRHYPTVVRLFTEGAMEIPVRNRALDIFERLGKAEAQVHGVTLDKVAFHEVGAWDSIADVFSAAWLVEAAGVTSWSCAALPLGGGRVQTAHGELAVPAPATTILLEGCPMHDDGRQGERITPTGAAILAHLQPAFDGATPPRILDVTGCGFGTRRLEGMSNVLRILAFTTIDSGVRREQVGLCTFEVDDQSPEALAAGLDRVRALDSVLDVVQIAALGKKGRLGTQVQVLARADAADAVLEACLTQTTTLGARWQVVERTSLERREGRMETGGHVIGVKEATRPDGGITRKAEMDDLAAAGATHQAREELRRRAEALPQSTKADAGDD